MTTWLLNSAVIPAGCWGEWSYAPATWGELGEALYGPHESRVGYPEAAALLVERMTGVRPAVSREASPLAEGDRAYVVRLKYRVAAPGTKGGPSGAGPDDWEVGLLVRRRGGG